MRKRLRRLSIRFTSMPWPGIFQRCTCEFHFEIENVLEILVTLVLEFLLIHGGSCLFFLTLICFVVDDLFYVMHGTRIGMIVTYCHGDKIGVTLLRQNSDHDCHRSSYALGLILRDCDEEASTMYLKKASNADFLPACQEIMESNIVKAKFGDLLAPDLEQHFDPAGLSRLLGSHYIRGASLRHVSSSHCWNPLCGRWALKAASQGSAQAQRQAEMEMVHQALPPLPKSLEVNLDDLLRTNARKQDAGALAGGTLAAAVASGICTEVSDHDNFRNRDGASRSFRVSRMKMCSQCRKAKYCSKLCQVYDWRSGRHKTECQYLDGHGGIDVQA